MPTGAYATTFSSWTSSNRTANRSYYSTGEDYNETKRLHLSAIAALGLAVLPSSVVAQQGALRQQLVGTWTLVSCETPTANAAFCTNPNGTLLLAPSGRYAQVIAARGQPKTTTAGAVIANRADVTPEYYKAIAQGLVANFGTWSVNEADKTLTRKFEGALFPNVEGAQPKSPSVSPAMD